MATIKDIARLAGVSHGTVSNVLNQRGNVSAAKIEKVKAAAKQLGYRVNAQAKLLRGGASKSVAVILPTLSGERYRLVYEGLTRFLLGQGYIADLYLTFDREETEKQALANLAGRQYEGVMAISCLGDASLYYQKLAVPARNIIFVYRNLANAQHFLDVDMAAAANYLAALISNKNYANLAVFTDRYSCAAASQFTQTLEKALSSPVRLRFIVSRDEECHKAAFGLLSAPMPDAVICADIEKVRHIRNAFHLGSLLESPPVYALCGEELRLEQNLCCYAMNYQELGKKVAQSLLCHPEQFSKPEPAINDDYRQMLPPAAPHRHKLDLLTIPSPSTDALEKLLPHFFRLSGIEVALTRLPFDQLAAVVEEQEQARNYDLLRIDMATFPGLAEKVFAPLQKVSPDLPALLDRFPDDVVKRYSIIRGTPCAIPFDPSIQLLFYRRDIFEDQKIRRLYFEQFRQQMAVPETFEQYDRLLAFFASLREKGETDVAGSCSTLGGAEMIASEFMLRYYAGGGRLLHKNGRAFLEPSIAIPALERYLAALKHSLPLHSNWWRDSVVSFERGELAMLIVYMHLFSEVAHGEMAPLIGFGAVPGGVPLPGGGAIGVSRHSAKKAQAAAFLKWLFSSTITEQFVLLGGSSASLIQHQNPAIKEAYPWLRLARHAASGGIRESYTPDGEHFDLFRAEKTIGESVADAIDKLITAEETITRINQALTIQRDIINR
ncbi:extracellular solute-binding protein [Kalamiella sp. sgz302252]|uniref:extracellular solute-binding protein n=1 Tax=Pantoea sp. sgz302252 TaxID=3341827 RepID=UPI0036D41A5C